MSDKLEQKVDRLEGKVDKLADVVTRLAGNVDEMRLEFRDSLSESRGIRKTSDDIKVVLNTHGLAISRIEKKIDLTNAQFGDVIKKVIDHDEKIENLDVRVSTIELGVH